MNLTVDTHKLPMLDKVNLHMQIGQLIVNYLYKTNATPTKAEKMLNKVIQQLKLEKANSRALNAQVEELKKIIIKVGVNPDDQAVVQKLLQSVKSEIGILKKKLNLPTGEHTIAARIDEVENEKGKLLQDVLRKTEERSLLKETLDKLQKQLDTHVFMVVMPSNTDDPATQVLQLGTKLKMAELDAKKAQRELETTCKLLNFSEEESRREKYNANKYIEDLLIAEDEIKRLKEKMKGNVSLIQAREILWDKIIEVIKGIWGFLVIISEEKTLIQDMEKVVTKNK